MARDRVGDEAVRAVEQPHGKGSGTNISTGPETDPQTGRSAHKIPPTPQYLRTTLLQLLVVLLVLPAVYVGWGYPAAISLLCGAACAVLPQGFFALRMATAARQSAARAARLGLAAEGGKFLLSAVSFALVFAVVRPAQPGLVFLGFGALWLVQLIDSIRMLRAR